MPTLGGRIALDDSGDGPAVIGMHGLTASRRYVLMGSRALERDGRRVVLLDARGHGASAPADGYDYEALAADVVAVLDELGIERATLVGASMGAHTAFRLALEHPERVAAIVAVTPAYQPDDFPGDLDRWDALAQGLRERGVEGFLEAYGLESFDADWRDTLERVIRQRLAIHEHPNAVADALQQVPRSRPFDSLHELRAITVPVHVVGTRDEPDPGHPLAVARAYAAAIPGAELSVEEPGASPLAWQGGRLSKIAAEIR